MFDTVSFRRSEPLPPSYELRERGFSKPHDGSGRHWFLNIQFNPSTLIRLDWHRTFSGDWLFAHLSSLPKFLYGNNVQMVETEAEVRRGSEDLSTVVSDYAGVNYDVPSSDVVVLHACHSWKLTEPEVYARLHALRSGHIDRMNRCLKDGKEGVGGVYFENASEQFTAYAKCAETLLRLREGTATAEHLSMAAGVFRIEHRYLNSDSVKRFRKRSQLPDQKAETLLRPDIAERILNEKMQQLGIDKEIEAGDVRLKRIRDFYGIGSNEYKHLTQFIALADEHGGMDNLVPLGLYSDSVFYKYRKELNRAGALLVAPAKTYLPALAPVKFHEDSLAMSNTIQRSPVFETSTEWLN
ncbi:MAG TPA: hypothetical protein VGV59_08765 [Pyrinomonadaceae bacterium]|nr:hypothetical protein [Pyrinomonadaceae bacterium]